MKYKNEKFIFSRIKSQDKDAFAAAYDMYVEQIYRFIYFKIGNKEEAEDLTSSVFLKTWNYIKDSEIKEKTLKALIYKIARNAIIDEYRKKALRDDISLEQNENVQEIVDDKQDIASRIDVGIEKEKIILKLNALKDDYRELIILRYIEDLSISEIAQIQSKTKGAVRVEAHRALKALKSLFIDENK